MYICPRCKRTREELVKEGKLNLVQGYEQCGYDRADLEAASVVLRIDIREEARQKAIENDDYTIMPPNLELARAMGVKPPKEVKIPNTSNYLPEWYLKERQEASDKINKSFVDIEDSYDDYNKIID